MLKVERYAKKPGEKFKKTLKTIIEIKPMSWTLPISDSSVPKMKR